MYIYVYIYIDTNTRTYIDPTTHIELRAQKPNQNRVTNYEE